MPWCVNYVIAISLRSTSSKLAAPDVTPIFHPQLIPQGAVEALDKAILHRLAGGDVMPFNLVTFSPAENRVAGQLRAIVADDGGGLAAPGHDGVQLTGDARA